MSPLAPPAYAAFEPHIDRQAADIALTGFFADVEKARREHGIADVFVVTQVGILQPDGTVRHGIASVYHGDAAANKLPLLARVYGQAREEHETVLGDLIEAGRRETRERLR